MAEVADLFLLHLDDLESAPFDFAFDTDDDNETLDPAPLCSSIFGEEPLISSWNHPLFLPESDPHISRSETDLFHRLPVPDSLDTSDFRALHSSDYLGIELGLGFDNQEDDEVDHPVIHPVIQIDGDSIQVVGFGSDDESENPNPEADEDLNLPPFCWDSLRLEEERVEDDDFEWEEVDGRIDERDILSMMVGEGSQEHEDDEEEDELRNVQWEAVNNPIEYEEGDFGIPSEYEILFGQFAEAVRGCPSAKKSVVESLKEVVLTKDDVEKGNAMCAVCKDEMEGKTKELPCSHRYHGECILPWLGMRNTCPVCRFELPTDDVEYESWKAHRSGVGNEGM